jgi:hypothetical protein
MVREWTSIMQMGQSSYSFGQEWTGIRTCVSKKNKSTHIYLSRFGHTVQ